MKLLHGLFADTLQLFYPHVCNGCGSDLLNNDQLLCLKCISNLPHTHFARHPGNYIEKIFWGRIPLSAAHSEFYFAKESLIQHLIHQLKYKNNQAIGAYLGELMGLSLLRSTRFGKIDGLVPLPLYPDKERKRGYNQAAVICDGMSLVMNVPVYSNNLVRRRFTETQTQKHRTERWENVAESFVINNEKTLAGKHFLIVDDVVTTGATLEAAGQVMLRVENVQLSLATLAFATK